MLLVLLIFIAVGVRVMTLDERAQLLRDVMAAIRRGQATSARHRRECEPFHNALRARTPWAIVTPALLALNATAFVFMLFGAGTLSDPETLIGWGGSFGPRTTTGEWWRLATMMFVHSGMLHLLASVAGLSQLGLMLERLVGRWTFAAVYLASGVFASLVSLATRPVGISVGASGAIFGLYGLLLASSIWSLFHRSSVTIPLVAAKRLGPAAAVFMLYNVANNGLGIGAELTGLFVGFVCGVVLTREVSDHKAPARRIVAAMAVAVMIAMAWAVSLRGIADVRPEIERLVAVEDRTASAYQTQADRFGKGRVTAEALAQLIEGTIMPELQAAGARLKALEGVRPEHRPLIADAKDYVRLRYESWRLRADGLRKTNLLALGKMKGAERASDTSSRRRAEAQHMANMLTLGKADGAERASLEVLERTRLQLPSLAPNGQR